MVADSCLVTLHLTKLRKNAKIAKFLEEKQRDEEVEPTIKVIAAPPAFTDYLE